MSPPTGCRAAFFGGHHGAIRQRGAQSAALRRANWRRASQPSSEPPSFIEPAGHALRRALVERRSPAHSRSCRCVADPYGFSAVRQIARNASSPSASLIPPLIAAASEGASIQAAPQRLPTRSIFTSGTECRRLLMGRGVAKQTTRICGSRRARAHRGRETVRASDEACNCGDHADQVSGPAMNGAASRCGKSRSSTTSSARRPSASKRGSDLFGAW